MYHNKNDQPLNSLNLEYLTYCTVSGCIAAVLSVISTNSFLKEVCEKYGQESQIDTVILIYSNISLHFVFIVYYTINSTIPAYI